MGNCTVTCHGSLSGASLRLILVHPEEDDALCLLVIEIFYDFSPTNIRAGLIGKIRQADGQIAEDVNAMLTQWRPERTVWKEWLHYGHSRVLEGSLTIDGVSLKERAMELGESSR